MSEESKEEEKPKEDPENPEDVEIKERTKKVTHRVEISRNPEIDALHDELAKIKQDFEREKEKWDIERQGLITKKEEVEEQLTVFEAEKERQALTMFEKDKADVLKLCKDSGLEEEKVEEIEQMLDSPTKLEMVKNFTNMLIAALPKKEKPEGEEKPSKKPVTQGKAPIIPPPEGEQHEDAIKMIDEIYSIIKDNTGKYSPEQKAEAQKKRLMLWNSLVQGKSIKDLRRGTTIGVTRTMSCPQCGNTIVGERIPDRCPHCGYDMRKTGDLKSTRGVIR